MATKSSGRDRRFSAAHPCVNATRTTRAARGADLRRPGISLAKISRDPVDHDRPLLESYAAKFPELGSLDRLPIELIGEEYRVRRVWGDRPEHAEFFSRFPAQHEQLRTELPRIDREIDEELAGSRSSGIASPATTACTTDADFEQIQRHSLFLASRHPAQTYDWRGQDGEGLPGVAPQLETRDRREVPAQRPLARAALGPAIHRRGDHHRQAASPEHRRNPRAWPHSQRRLFHRHGPRLGLRTWISWPGRTSSRWKRSSRGPWSFATLSNMRTRRGLSTAISNPRISCSMSTGGCASRTSALRAHSPGTRPGPPRLKGPRRSWRRNRFLAIGDPLAFELTSMESGRSFTRCSPASRPGLVGGCRISLPRS